MRNLNESDKWEKLSPECRLPEQHIYLSKVLATIIPIFWKLKMAWAEGGMGGKWICYNLSINFHRPAAGCNVVMGKDWKQAEEKHRQEKETKN